MTTQHDLLSVPLGPNGLRVSPIGVGTWAWGDRLVWGYGKAYNDSDLRQAFDVCLEAGITFFDTAEIYGFGRSEALIGQFARTAPRPIFIATKFFPYPWRLLKGDLKAALQASLRRLGVQQVDLYQIHWPLGPRSIRTWMSAMADVAEAGLVRAIGVSNYSAAQMREAQAVLTERGLSLASNQVSYSLLNREPERNGVLDTCQELGATLIAYSPLAMGLLTGKYTPGNPPPLSRGAARLSRERWERVSALLDLMREIGERHGGKTPAQVAINWTICKGALPIPGAKNARQAQDNVAAANWRLTDDEVRALDEASR